jgi:RNA polymerase sigma factor (TIGR02999 family)
LTDYYVCRLRSRGKSFCSNAKNDWISTKSGYNSDASKSANPRGNGPMSPSPEDVTQLLVAWSNGDQGARDELMSVVYHELHRLAHQYMKREHPGHTLQTSALVNEAFLRLIDQRDVRWQNRAHFFGIAAQVMRRILVDYARSRSSAKRGGAARGLPLDEAIVSDERSEELVTLDEALQELAKIDLRKSKVVELKFFAGLSIEEAAVVLDVSPGTVMRDWTLAKAWLRREMSNNNHAC